MIKKIIGNIITLNQRIHSFDDRVSSWQEAKKVTEGYDSNTILNKVVSAHVEAQEKNNSYERDSVVLSDNLINWPLVGTLYWAEKNISKNLQVLDFGGSFASAFFQNLRVLSSLDIKWMVVEQQHFVDAAKKIVNDTRVTFFSDVEACIKSQKPNFAHLGSSLQYLEKPYHILEKISLSEIEVLILDRIPVYNGVEDIVAAQRVSNSIYDSSYPVWILSEEKLKKEISHHWVLLSEFDAIGGSSRTLKQKKFKWKGYIFVRNMAG